MKTCEFKTTVEEFVVLEKSTDLDQSYDVMTESLEKCSEEDIDQLKSPFGLKVFDMKKSPRKGRPTKVKISAKKTKCKKQIETAESQAVKSITNLDPQILRYDRAVEKMDHFFNQKDLAVIKKGYKCPDCNKVYTKFSTAKSHLKTDCNKEPDNCCHLCEYKTRQATNLKRHIALKHLAPDIYICSHCNKEFNNKQHFTHHIRYMCDKANPVECHLCDFKTKIPGILNSHLLKKHNIFVKPKDKSSSSPSMDFPDPIKIPEGFKCPDCDLWYRHIEGYRKHRIVACGKTKSLKCIVKECGYITKNYINMQQHLKRRHNLLTTVRKNEMILLG